jgi:hypothetical protein
LILFNDAFLPTAMMPRLIMEKIMMKILSPSCSEQQQQNLAFDPSFGSLQVWR